MSATAHARSTLRKTGADRALRTLARVGFVASGLIHLLLGYLAIQVAAHHSARSDQSGALAAIGKLPGGDILLWITTVGLFALALWLVVSAVLGVGSGDVKRWLRTLVPIAKALAYFALGLTALAFAQGSSSNSASSTKHASSTVLHLPGGQLLLGLVGLIALGVGVYMVVKGARQGFKKDLAMPSGTAGRVVTAFGTVGYIAKGIAVGVVGILFLVAAVTVDPNRASGLDGALRALAALPFGAVLLVGVGIGLIAFGLYTFVRARYARL
ncbi:DUF1206 domain-containing protein [Amnibacterium sp.]|uniref:DUF1206 domain-containing protein n=1 Tax=Amnibacterium sp. TaxID=1872496 RepID=UPI003F7BFC6B